MTMVYDLPIADTSAQPMSQVQGFTAPDSKDFSSAQLQEGGAALTKAGIATTQIVKTIQDDIDTATTKEMDNKLADAIRVTLYDPENGYLKTPGKRALESRPVAIKGIQDAAKEIESGLQNDVQRYMFKKAAMVRMQSAMLHIDSHAMQQAKVYAGAAAKARMDGARLDALQNWAGWKDPRGLYARSKAVMMGEVKALAQTAGIPENSTQFKLLENAITSKLHTDVIEQFLANDKAKEAEGYYQVYKERGEISPELYATLDKKVNDGVAYVDGKAKGDEEWLKGMRGKTLNDVPPVDAMLKTIEDDPLLSLRGKEYAKAKVLDNESKYRATKGRNEEGASNQIAGLMLAQGSTYSQVKNKIMQLTTVDEKARRGLLSAADSHFKVSEDRAIAKADAKMKQTLQYYSNLYQFQRDYTSGAIPRMDAKGVMQYMSTLGSATDDAMRFVEHANATSSTVHLTMTDLENELRIMKTLPAYANLDTIPRLDKQTDTDKANMALIYQKVVSIKAASGKSGKQKSTQAALAEILPEIVTKKGYFSDSRTPIYQLGTKYSGDPKTWPLATAARKVKADYYLQYGTMKVPPAEFDRRMRALTQ